jgi:(2Fe-2S) ferredoxin
VILSVIVCGGPVCGGRRGSAALLEHARARVAAPGLAGRVTVREEICLGHCLRGPNILVCEGEDALAGPPAASGRAVLYNHMTIADLDRVVERHLVGGMAVRALTNLPPIPSGKGRPP